MNVERKRLSYLSTDVSYETIVATTGMSCVLTCNMHTVEWSLFVRTVSYAPLSYCATCSIYYLYVLHASPRLCLLLPAPSDTCKAYLAEVVRTARPRKLLEAVGQVWGKWLGSCCFAYSVNSVRFHRACALLARDTQ